MFKPPGHRGNVPVPPTRKPDMPDNNEESGEEWSDDEFDEEQENYENLEAPARAAPVKPPPRPVPLPPKVDSEPSLPPLPPRGGLAQVRAAGECAGSGLKDALQAALANRMFASERPLPSTPVAKPPPAITLSTSSSSTLPRTGRLPPVPPPLLNNLTKSDSFEEVYEITDSSPPPVPSASSRPLPPPPTVASKSNQRPRIPSEDEDEDAEYLDADEMAPSRSFIMNRPIPLPPLPEPPLPDGTRVMSGVGAEINSEDQDVYESGDMYTGADDPDIAQFHSRPSFPTVKTAVLPMPGNKLMNSAAEPKTKKPEISVCRPVPTLPAARPLPEPGLRNNTPKIAKSLPAVNVIESSGGPPTPSRPLPVPPPSKGLEIAGTKKLEIPVIKSPSRWSAADAETESSTVSSELLDIKSRLKPVKTAVNSSSSSSEVETDAKTGDVEKSQSFLGLKEQSNAGYERNSNSYRSRSPAGRDCRDPLAFKPSPSGSTENLPGAPVPNTEAKAHASASMVRGQSFQVPGSTDDMGAGGVGTRRPSAPVLSAPQRSRLETTKARPLPPVPDGGVPRPPAALHSIPDHVESFEEDLSDHGWYIGQVNRREAEAKVKGLGQDGAFVVRISQNGGVNNPYTLTLLYRNNPYNLHIRKRTDGKYAIGNEKPDEIVFPAVPDLVTFYLNNVIDLIGDSRRSIAAGRVTLRICYAR